MKITKKLKLKKQNKKWYVLENNQIVSKAYDLRANVIVALWMIENDWKGQ